MEINAFVTLRRTFSVGSTNQMNLPPEVRDMLQRSLQRSSAFGLPSGLVIGPPTELSGASMGPGTDGTSQPEHPLAGALFPGAAGVLSGNDAAAALAAAGGVSTPAMNERIRRLSGAIAGSIFGDLVTGAIRVGDPGPPPASESAIAKLERGLTPKPGATCTICLCGLEEAPSEGDGSVPTLARMPCGHDFHEPCLLHWVREHNTCPVCRHALEHDQQQPRMAPLISMLHGWREAAEAASAPGAALGEGPVGALELPLGLELSGGQMRLFHPGQPPSDGAAPAAAPYSLSTPASVTAALERMAALHRRRAAAQSAEESRAEADGPTSRLSIPELNRRLEAIGVQPPEMAPKAELVRLLNLHERLHRVSRRPGRPQLRLQLQMQMVQLQQHMAQQPPEEGAASSPPRSGRGTEEEEAEAGGDHCAKRQRNS
jgi:hypothetical protein